MKILLQINPDLSLCCVREVITYKVYLYDESKTEEVDYIKYVAEPMIKNAAKEILRRNKLQHLSKLIEL